MNDIWNVGWHHKTIQPAVPEIPNPYWIKGTRFRLSVKNGTGYNEHVILDSLVETFRTECHRYGYKASFNVPAFWNMTAP